MFRKNTSMTLENNGAPEHFISDIKDETELVESENDAIHDIKEELVKEEPTGTKFFSSYVEYEQGEEEKFHKPDLIDSSQLEDMLEKNEVPEESKPFSTREFPSTECMNFKVESLEYDLAGEQENPEDYCFNEMKIKHENQDCSLPNYHELETETLKTEDSIDIEDVKPEICEKKKSGKSENKPYSNSTDILMGTKIGPIFPQELPTDSGTGTQQSTTIEEDETGAKWDNDTRKEPTITNNSNNGQMISSKMFTIDKPFKCKVCSKSFSEKRSLVEHKKIHRGEKPFQCKMCSKSFPRKHILVDHERIHTGEKPYQCKVCAKSFSGRRSLKAHGRVHTGEKPFQCKICSKSFPTKQILVEHERIHTGEKPFQCKICSKSFYRKQILEQHERIHTGEKPFQCTICSKSFVQSCHFTQHMKIHTGEKPFECKFCSKSFAWKTSLVLHERVHTGEKPFQCNICSKSFVQKNALIYHERVHTNEKPFHCEICSKSFGQKSDYMKHEKIHQVNKK